LHHVEVGPLSGRLLRDPANRLLAARSAAGASQPTSESAMVFAPHPDDETLACGGVIALKVRRGARVRIVFLTDGSRSPVASVAPEDLARARATEAKEAAAVLGVPEEDVSLLGFPDGRLGEELDEATSRVRGLLEDWRPHEVYLPWALDPQTDHQSASRIVTAALAGTTRRTVCYQYPVWFWHTWPWVGRSVGSRRSVLGIYWRGLRSLGTVVTRFRWVVDVRSALDTKRAALACHRSQMEVLGDDPAWPTLPDLSGGDFMACFFRGQEAFYRYVVPVGSGGHAENGRAEGR